jgi:hypothetical protein
MREGRYERLYERHWARALLVIMLLSTVVGLLLCWMESR